MAIVDSNALERLRYWIGQTLRSADFRDQLDDDDSRRWWHNRAHHDAYGVSLGLAVNKQTMVVSCGVAHDCRGAEILLEQPRKVSLPIDGPERQLLVISRRALWPAGSVALDALSTLQWIPAEGFRRSMGVAIARTKVASGRWEIDDTFQARQARPMSRPRIAAGATRPHSTAWQPVADFGLELRVDTTAAGFTDTPVYMASAVWNQHDLRFSPAFFTSIAEPRPDSFVLRLLFRGIGRQIHEVAKAFGRVRSADLASRHIVFRETSTAFKVGDVISRVLPLSALGIGISTVQRDKLTLRGSPADIGAADGRLIVLGHTPRVSTLLAVVHTSPITVANVRPFTVGEPLALVGGTAAGSAAIVEEVLSDNVLLLRTPVALRTGDRVAAVKPGGVVERVSGMTVTFQADHDLADSDIVFRIRTIDQNSAGKVVRVIDARNVELDVDLGLIRGDKLGKVDTRVTRVQQVMAPSSRTIVMPKSPARFEVDDVVASADAGSRDVATVQDIKRGRLVLDRRLTLNAEGSLVAALRFAAATVEDVTDAGLSIKVSRPTVFAPGDMVLDAKSTTPRAAFVHHLTDTGIVLVTPIPQLARGDVITVSRFVTPVPVESIGNAPDDRQQLVLRDATVFRKADHVGVLSGSGGQVALSVIDDIQGRTVTLQSSLPVVGGDLLAVVALPMVAAVQDVSGSVIQIDTEKVCREGDLACRFADRVDDATPQSLVTSVSPLTVDRWLDGLQKHDLVSYAAITPAQTNLRFGTTADIEMLDRLTIAGVDLLTHRPLEIDATVQSITEKLAVLILHSAPAVFRIRPETATITGVFNARVPGAFATYAEQQGLHVNWIGCQPPRPRPAPCAPAADPCRDHPAENTR